MERLHEETRKCMKCGLCKDRIKAVPGEGPSNAELMFVGEAPGRMEAEKGRPFIGRAGKLLTDLIQSIGLDRKEVFITSVVKCRPPKNRKPTKEEVEACMPYLKKQMEVIKPKVVVLLGNTAIQSVLGGKTGVTKVHGKTVARDGRLYFLTFHPAAGIRGTRIKQKLFEDFKELKKIIGKR
jgi:DNA polymerase